MQKIENIFTMIDENTVKYAKMNLHLHIPPNDPSVVNTEKGPTCRNFVIPKDPVMIEITYVAANHAIPPKPPYIAHLLLSG